VKGDPFILIPFDGISGSFNKTKQNKNKSMKATKENKYASVNFTSLEPIMAGIWQGECKLMDALLAIWNAQVDKSAPLEFRKAFVAFAVAKGYSEKWAGEVACDAGFRLRAKGGGRKASDKPKADSKGVTPEQLAHMARALDAKGVKKLIALLAAM